MEYIPVRVSDIIRNLNRDVYLPAIQREFVWEPERIERLFDSIMSDFPIGSFLYWRLAREKKDDWPIYEFIREFNKESPHNPPANMAGVGRDLTLVLDGQQRITSLYIGLRGSYSYFYYRQRTERLYLNLLKPPVSNEDNPDELTYGFSFREDDTPKGEDPQYWYPVGRILDHEDAEDAKIDIKSKLASFNDAQQENANRLVGRLHSCIHTKLIGNYYEERSQDYDKVLQVFVRANSGGQALEYSDILLATATARWETLDARKEIHDFTDTINKIGNGYSFGKDFVLKACLYLSDSLPIQYKIKNFTRANLKIVEQNWESIKSALSLTVRLVAKFGFNDKNVVAPLALLPIAFFLLKRGNWSFDASSNAKDVSAQIAIRRWFVFSTLKNAFGSSSDTTLTRLRELLLTSDPSLGFPTDVLYKSLGIAPSFSEPEIEKILGYAYQARYTNLVLSLLYPDRNWKDAIFHEDHIFPQTEFATRSLRKRGYDDAKVAVYQSQYNALPNLQLLTDSENLSKNSTPFHEWLKSRDDSFRDLHLIPELDRYEMDDFEKFYIARRQSISDRLAAL